MNATKTPFIQFFGVFRKSLPWHFWLLQAVCLIYVIYRFASRDYTIYGMIDWESFVYPRHRSFDPWPTPLSHITSLVFLYEWIPGPSVNFLFLLQCTIIGVALCGLLGILPRLCVRLVFIGFLHMTGLVLATNSEIEGGTTSLITLFVLSLSPKGSFYTFKHLIGKGPPIERKVDHHWPLFLFLLFMSAFYTSAGLLKLIETGPNWAFRLHLERLGASHLGHSFFTSSRGYLPELLWVLKENAWFTPIAGILTQVSELFFFTVLFIPKLRWFFVANMMALHTMVFLSAGINFMGNGFLLLMCFDYNRLAEKLKQTAKRPKLTRAHSYRELRKVPT